ncbi:MAG: ribonuclease Y [Candidatus Magasanikbacteria bacterium CG10_big_fil_rev_8_21_14_0_10_40_10]|uniref:Ribonuclease Y n=1 Tax=Candidatus Magasanikbacteria bacterium CG10_big_fil_rev_8_21_14_0_10_40_10 TaxID=1974648 RepID=A0A2M6W4E9_9BACT|nr:MAG: ribonuclease Y [Candidatus Magasanikbacteria bacterium CG10_big_fil_rev_8_21_14_0_10_40_10]
MNNILIASLTIAGAFIAFLLGFWTRKKWAQTQANSIEAKAEKILAEAKSKQQELILQAKEKAVGIIEESKNEEKQMRLDLQNQQKRLEKREGLFDQKLLEFQGKQEKMQENIEKVQDIKKQVEQIKEDQIAKLQNIAGLSRDEAKETLMQKVENESHDDLMIRIMKLEKEGSNAYENKAREIILDTIQRCASSHAAENTSSTVDLPSEEMKGRIIGKEGRNIKTIEKLTGCELVIDDTPNSILISGFSPIRRQVAKLALEKLMADGRIQPARIEEFVDKAKQDLAIEIKKTGEEALYKMGLTGIDPKLVSIVGRLKYRTSYGQNILNHSMEVAHLAGVMANELGLDGAKAKKCGFFHDIGKAVDQETQGTHPQIGEMILRKFNMDEDIIQSALTHHDDKPTGIYAVVTKSADAISGARIGARKDSYEQFIARLEELENTVKSFPGIEKVYAIQAGREVRIFVLPNEVDDYQSHQLAKDIARKIEQELQYPGEIKVTIIRECRVIEYAK